MIILITNGLDPYKYDVAHLLSLPNNFIHRFRYWSKWLDPNINLKKIKNRAGAIGFRDFNTGKLTLIRKISIINLLTVGDINYIEFSLRNYIDKKNDAELINQFDVTIKDKKPGEDLSGLVFDMPMGCECQYYYEQDDDSDKSNQLWDEIISHLGVLECFEKHSFFKILSIKDSDGSIAEVCKEDSDFRNLHAYRVYPNRSYYLEVIQKMPWELENSEVIGDPYDLSLLSGMEDVFITRTKQRVVGKYDLLKFGFSTRDSIITTYPEIRIQKDKSSQQEYDFDFYLCTVNS